MNYYFKIEERRHSEEMLNQSKKKSQKSKPQAWQVCAVSGNLGGSTSPALLLATCFSLLGWYLHPHLSLAGVSWLWELTEIQASLSQLLTMASQGLHAEATLANTWHQWLSTTTEAMIPWPLYQCFLYDSKIRNVNNIAKFCCLLGMESGLTESHLQ